jgi:sugar lactone lactonase YvrE
MSRSLACALTVGMVLLAASTGAQSAREQVARERELAREAHGRKDHDAFLVHSRRLVELAPRSVGALYNLACAEALLGNAPDATRLLERLAGMGLAPDAAADPDFERVKAATAFQQALVRLAENRKPIERGEVAFTLPERGLIPEGVAYDAKAGAFFVSSIRQRKVVRRDAQRGVRDFVPSGQDGLLAAAALAVDDARRALWVSTAAVPEMVGFRKEQEGQSFVLEYDLDTGRLRRRLSPPLAGGRVSDLAVGPGGELAVSDPITGRVYLLENDALRVLVDPGPLGSPQGLAFAPDGRLFVADYVQGPARVDLRTGAVHLLDAPADAALTGIDGLVWNDGALIGIQNGVEPHRVVRLTLEGDRVAGLHVLERAHARYDEPTLGVVVGGSLYYVANSQYAAVRQDGSLDEARLREAVILRLPLAP